MKRWLGALLISLWLCALRAEDELPLPESGSALEVEPPLLIQSRTRDGTPEVTASLQETDLAKLEADLARARKRAATGEGLYRAGIIAKVESEERVLKVVRLEAALAEARFAAAKSKLTEQKAEANMVEIEAQLRASQNQVAVAARDAERATSEKNRAELDAALLNLKRQQKLLALGSGRKADVNRAERKLAELQGGAN